ncbi:hypothetical protein UlMin_042771 [Ulmus minor]
MLNVLMNAFGIAGRYLEAESIYHHIKESGFTLDVVTYTTLMKAFIRAKKFDKVGQALGLPLVLSTKKIEVSRCFPLSVYLR